jgi:dUTP pyrophosphatase
MSIHVLFTGDGPLPIRAYPGDAGGDLTCTENVWVDPGQVVDVATGLAMQLPDGWWGWITARSSTLRRRGLRIEAGIIDNGFRGPLFVCVHNVSPVPVQVCHGDRLAQLILLPLAAWSPQRVEQLSDSDRGTNGFGSSGI